MDDFTPYGSDFEEALKNLGKVLTRCEQTQLSLSTEKCHMMMNEGVVLGHFISADGIQVDPSKIRVIENIPTLGTQKEVRSFLGHVVYYRRFIENFSKLASPLFTFLMKDVHFIWNDPCQTMFTILKKRMSTTPILRGLNWALHFHISSDASDTTIRAVLGQQDGQVPYAIYYISKNLSLTELNYTVIEK